MSLRHLCMHSQKLAVFPCQLMQPCLCLSKAHLLPYSDFHSEQGLFPPLQRLPF